MRTVHPAPATPVDEVDEVDEVGHIDPAALPAGLPFSSAPVKVLTTPTTTLQTRASIIGSGRPTKKRGPLVVTSGPARAFN